MLTNNKNKALILVLVLYFFINTSFSQTIYSNKESSTFGLTVGMTSSNLYRDTIKYDPAISFTGGLVYVLSITEKSNVGLELLYTGKVVKKSKPITRFNFSYIDLPIYYQRKISDNIRIDAGIQYSIFANSKFDTLDGSKASGVHFQPLKTKMGNDFGVLAGLEFGITKNFFVSARYTLSVKSLSYF